jgi:hypothetical protein
MNGYELGEVRPRSAVQGRYYCSPFSRRSHVLGFHVVALLVTAYRDG